MTLRLDGGVKCPACGSLNSEVVDARPTAGNTRYRRRRWCVNVECGMRWTTIEKTGPDPEFAKKARPHTTNGVGPPQVIDDANTTNRASEAQQDGFGRGGGGSDNQVSLSISRSSGSVLDPIPSLSPDQGVDRARARQSRPVEYGDAFEILWEQTGRRGGKFPAWKAWRRVGSPTWDAIRARWVAYLASERPQAGFVKDLSSWLNGRGHEQDWEPAPEPRRNGSHDTKGSRTTNALMRFMERHGDPE